jgi:uncharacterized protein (DUF1330 family)
MIVTAIVHDRDKFIHDYGIPAGRLLEQFGGQYLLKGPGAELLEGEFGAGGSMVISEWPDKATALSFWNSPEYAEIKKARQGLADVQVLLIEAPTIER